MEDMMMVRDKDYLKLFSDNAEDRLTETELSEIIDEELLKSEEEMDTELIENCLDAINRLKIDEQKEVDTDVHVKKFSLRRWVAAAVAAVFVLSFSALLFFKKPQTDFPKQELCTVLEENGYGAAHLPSALFTNECSIISVKTEPIENKSSRLDTFDETKTITVSFEYKGKSCNIKIGKQKQQIEGEKISLPEPSGINAEIYRTESGYLAVYKTNGGYCLVQMPVSLSEFAEFVGKIK